MIRVVNFHVLFTDLVFSVIDSESHFCSASCFNALHSRWKKLSASKRTFLFAMYFSKEGIESNCFLKSKDMNVINQVVLKSVSQCSRNNLMIKLVVG